MPLKQSTQPAESPKLSAMEQRVSDAMDTPAAQEAIAKSHAALAIPREKDEKPFNLKEWAEKAVQESVDNLNRNVMMSKQEPTHTPEKPWAKLSPEGIASMAEWLERTKTDLQPAESPKLSKLEQMVSDAMDTVTPTEAVKAAPLSASELASLWERQDKAHQEAVDNLNRKTLMGL